MRYELTQVFRAILKIISPLLESLTHPSTDPANIKQEDLLLWGLLVWTNNGLPPYQLANQNSYTVGRSPNADINVTEHTFGDLKCLTSISRLQCELRKEVDPKGIQIFLKDTSNNGTWVNGKLVGKGNSRLIFHGDSISFWKNTHLFSFLSATYKVSNYGCH